VTHFYENVNQHACDRCDYSVILYLPNIKILVAGSLYFTSLFSQTGCTTYHNIYFNFVNNAKDPSDQQVEKKWFC
jgi:hypothetical protein